MSKFYHVDEKYEIQLPVHCSYLSRIFINDEKKGGATRKERLLVISKLF